MFWYIVTACSAGLLIWNHNLRRKVKRIQKSTPELYEAARSACLSLNVTSRDFYDKVESIPLGHLVMAITDLKPETAPPWSALKKVHKDVAPFMLMADSLRPLEIRYIQLFMSDRERAFFKGVRDLDPRGLRE